MKPQLGPSLPMVNAESQRGLSQFGILYYYKARAHPMMLVRLGTFYVVRYIYHEQCLLHLVIYVHQPNAIINQLYQLYTPLNHNCPVCLGTKFPVSTPCRVARARHHVPSIGRRYMERPHVSTMVWLAGLNDVPNISKPCFFFETMGWNISKFYCFWRNMA